MLSREVNSMYIIDDCGVRENSYVALDAQLHITEAVKQLRGNEVEPERQVANAKVGIVSGHGGSLAMHATLILGAL